MALFADAARVDADTYANDDVACLADVVYFLGCSESASLRIVCHRGSRAQVCPRVWDHASAVVPCRSQSMSLDVFLELRDILP